MMFFLKYILPIIGIVLLVWAAHTWRENDKQHWRDEGRTQLAAEIAAATLAAEEETRKMQADINTKTREVVHEVRKAQGADAPASPYLRSVVDRLREQQDD